MPGYSLAAPGAVAVGIAAALASPALSDGPAGSLKVVPSANGVYAGVYNIGDPLNVYEQFTEKSGGRPAPITFTFHDWNGAGVEAAEPVLQTFADPLEGEDSPSPLKLAGRVAEDGGVLAVAWEAIGYFYEHPDYFTGGGTMAIHWQDVLAGRYDNYIRTVAREVKAFGKPIMLSPAGEFNSIGYFSFGPDGNRAVTEFTGADLSRHYGDPNTPDGPERLRDLYRHVVDIFREEHAHNVTWFLYSHSAYMNPADLDEAERERIDSVHPRHYYPGDDYVDWIGSSIYVDADDPGSDLAFAAEASLAAFRSFTDKPFFAPEFGVVSASDADRADRLRRLLIDELAAYPDIRAFAMADGELWAKFFDIPNLGDGDGELHAWQDAILHSGRYADQVETRRVPEPAAAAAPLLLLAASGPRRDRRACSAPLCRQSGKDAR